MLPKTSFSLYVNILRAIKGPGDITDPRGLFHSQHEPSKGGVATKSNRMDQTDQKVGLILHMAEQLPVPGQRRRQENVAQDGEKVQMPILASSTVFNVSCLGNNTFKNAPLWQGFSLTWDVKTEALTSCGH